MNAAEQYELPPTPRGCARLLITIDVPLAHPDFEVAVQGAVEAIAEQWVQRFPQQPALYLPPTGAHQ